MSDKLNFTVHPGEYLDELLTIKNMSQVELANRLDVSPKHVSQIINGKASINPEMSIAFENIFGTTSTYWQRLQSSYDSFIARRTIEQEIEQNKEWISLFDYKSLVSYHLVKPTSNIYEKGKELFRFFEVKDYDAWEKTWSTPAMEVYCRSTNRARNNADPKIIAKLATWIRIGQIQVEEQITPSFPSFNREKLKLKIKEVRDLNIGTEPEEMIYKLREVLGTAGVYFHVLPAQSGMNTYASTFLVRNNSVACIQVSLRGKTHDQLWFTLLHEIFHLLNRGNQQGFFIGEHCNEKEESLADEFAANTLIDPEYYRNFIEDSVFTGGSIKAFADNNRVQQGIVVGRLQHDKIISFKSFNNLKVRYRFDD
ncbi:MAG: HigA family addiction module antidote protein [Anaerolineaceae bacterium]|nr:HigA family addiction module antidote protein [Anaerolineaceae bacterium]